MTRIRAFRQARNLTQKQFAEMVGVTQGAVSHWESGAQISLKYIPVVATLLGLPISELFYEHSRAA